MSVGMKRWKEMCQVSILRVLCQEYPDGADISVLYILQSTLVMLSGCLKYWDK